MNGQISIFDHFSFERFQEYCKHSGAKLVFDENEGPVEACGFKNGKPAKCWDDWIKCEEKNCEFFKSWR